MNWPVHLDNTSAVICYLSLFVSLILKPDNQILQDED